MTKQRALIATVALSLTRALFFLCCAQQRLLNITSNMAMLTQEITRLKENQEEDMEESREGTE